MKPAIGRTVIYREGDYEAPTGFEPKAEWRGTNGTRNHPAVITRVWTETCVNLTVFTDAMPPRIRPSQIQLPELPDDVTDSSGNSGWRWPDRV